MGGPRRRSLLITVWGRGLELGWAGWGGADEQATKKHVMTRDCRTHGSECENQKKRTFIISKKMEKSNDKKKTRERVPACAVWGGIIRSKDAVVLLGVFLCHQAGPALS